MNRLLFFIYALFLSVNSCILQPLHNINERIVGGDYGNIYDVPYSAALLFDKDQVESFWPTCTGTVIGIKTVLTSAQCTNGTLAIQWLIRAGSSYMNSGGQLRFAAYFVQHPDFNHKFENDLSIIFVQSDFIVQPALVVATLPFKGQIIDEGSIASISGWGSLYEDGVVMSHIYTAQVPIINQEKCVEAYSLYNNVTENMICAGNLEDGGVGFCSEDLGGPLAFGYQIIGIASWSNGCARPNFPGVWTRVSKYRDWIDTIL